MLPEGGGERVARGKGKEKKKSKTEKSEEAKMHTRARTRAGHILTAERAPKKAVAPAPAPAPLATPSTPLSVWARLRSTSKRSVPSHAACVAACRSSHPMLPRLANAQDPPVIVVHANVPFVRSIPFLPSFVCSFILLFVSIFAWLD